MGHGLPPKPDDERQRRNPPRWDIIPVEWDGVVRLPDLPEDWNWCERTRQWWKVWQESPQSMVMVETDYQYMLETAYIHNRIFSDPDRLAPTYFTNLLAELRRRVNAYGATWEDRMKLRMQITNPHQEKAKEQRIQRAVEETVDYFSMVNESLGKKTD